MGEQLLQKVNTDPASFYWHFTVLGSFYVSKYVSAKMDAIIATSFPCFKLSNGRSYLWHCSRVRNSSDGSGFRLRISYNSYMAVCFVFVAVCVLYLLRCILNLTLKSSSVSELTSCRLTILSLVELSSWRSIPSVMLPHLCHHHHRHHQHHRHHLVLNIYNSSRLRNTFSLWFSALRFQMRLISIFFNISNL